ncbi:MAG TPA: hypothetical protein VE976_00480 [Actinomycetota bacterium]|nr:hypothetical protein [Actinomycetota bacterium]
MEQATQPVGEPFSAWPEYVAESEAIIAAAAERGLHLRLLGALAVIKQCPGGVWLLEKTNRVLTDLDFMGYDKEIRKVEAMFAELGYEVLGGRGVTMDVWVGRRIFHDPSGVRRRVDVFLDRLDFCHPIELKGRLELDPVTIPLTDILLEKLQIVEINEKDLKDLVVLLLEHDLAEGGEPGRFDVPYLVSLLTADWGFSYTVSLNFDRIRRYMDTIPELSVEQKAVVAGRLDALWQRVEAAPKGLKWRMRARVGPSRRWYNEVGEGYRELGREGGAWEG